MMVLFVLLKSGLEARQSICHNAPGNAAFGDSLLFYYKQPLPLGLT